ncbi:hypothetical protein UlMin_016471, partial [Ulmus minor]
DRNPSFVVGKTIVRIFNKTKAPLEETEFKVLLELTGGGSGLERVGVDLVMVLDVSMSMGADKLKKMIAAVKFVMNKLSPIDRLSVVTFAHDSKVLCPLRQISETSQADIEKLVNDLVAHGNANITAGLETALNVLKDRRYTMGRGIGIMLMSDGVQNEGGDASKVQVGNVPVYTFGFGTDFEQKVLKAIADNSCGGTFAVVQNEDNLSIAFSECLAGLLSVVVEDTKVTFTQVDSAIEKVSAGNYPQSRDNAVGSITVSFGNLYCKELCKVIVDLLLPAVSIRQGADVLEITYSYSTGGRLFEANPLIVCVSRTGHSAPMIKEARVVTEKLLQIAEEMILEAQKLVDEHNPLIETLESEIQKLKGLMKSQSIYKKQVRSFKTPLMDKYLEQAKVFEADPIKPPPRVEEDVIDEPNPLIEMLKSELQQLKQLMETKDINKNQGHTFAPSSDTSHDHKRYAGKSSDEGPSKPLPTVEEDVMQETSHDRQRFAAPASSDVENVRLFATPRMDKYLEQAESFVEEPEREEVTAQEIEEERIRSLENSSTASPLRQESAGHSNNEEENLQVLIGRTRVRERIPESLNWSNYLDWSTKVKTYLQELKVWKVIVEASPIVMTESFGNDGENSLAIRKAIQKLRQFRENWMALIVIKEACGFPKKVEIISLDSARTAWETLAANCNSYEMVEQ